MRKFTSVMLVLAMLMLCLPFAFAAQGATEDNSQQIEYVGDWNPTNYDRLATGVILL